MKTQKIEEIAVHKFPYPFVKSKYVEHDEEGAYEIDSWKPGTRIEQISLDEFEGFADAMGFQIITIISIHKPGKYPARAFYTRQWEDPSGNVWGDKKLRVKALSAINRDIKGYRHCFTIKRELEA